MWSPSPKDIKTVAITSELIACGKLNYTFDPQFESDLLLLIDRTQNYEYSQEFPFAKTVVQGEVVATTGLSLTNRLVVSRLFKQNAASITFTNPVLINNTLTSSTNIAVSSSLTSGQNAMGTFFRPTLSANESLQLILGKDSGFYNFGYLSYVNSTPPYLWSYCAYTSDGIKIYENKVDVVSSIKVKNVDMYGSSVTSVLSISTANPTSSLQFSRPRLYEFSIQFINCVKGTQRSNVFLQCGQGSVFPLTASNYSGVTGGSYSYDLTPNHNVLSTTDNGIAIFNDVLEVGSSISGSITFTVVGASTGTGILYAYTLQTYSNVPTNGGAAFGFGTVQMPAAYPTMTAVRLFCFNGNFTGGTMMIVYN